MPKLKIVASILTVMILIFALIPIEVLGEESEGLSDEEYNAAVNGMQVDEEAYVSASTSSILQMDDYSRIDSKDAVALLIKLGLINGKVLANQTVVYEPDSHLTRGEMAKMIAVACTLVSKETIIGKTTFADIANHWAADYIQYDADKGIISEIENGNYDPEAPITGLEAAKILLSTMGNNSFSDSDWKTKTELAAEEKGLLKKTKMVGDKLIDRDDAAQLFYNALTICDGKARLPRVLVVSSTTEEETLVIGSNERIVGTEGKLVSLVVGGKEMAMNPGIYTNAILVVTDKVTTNPSSYSGRGIDDFRAAICIDQTGFVQPQSVSQAVYNGTYSSINATDIKIDSTSDNFTAVKVDGAEYTIKNAVFNLLGKSDGSNVSDFTGLGSAISCYNNAKVTLEKVTINTEGVACAALYVDGGSDTLFTDSTFNVRGGNLYNGYVSTADQSKMVAPPWVLGITGNARGTNLMGDYSTSTFVRSVCNANQWGVLSTDAGSKGSLYVVDSVLTLTGGNQKDPFSTNYGSGYGTYIIGDAKEYFYGAIFNVGTYASILTGGEATYASSRFTEPLNIYAQNDTDTPIFTGITGNGQNTVIDSDAFGFMAHQSGTLNITDRTVVNTDNATFLLKSGDVNINVNDGAKLNTEDGVILQMMDNDDKIVGAEMSSGGPIFNTEFNETPGFPGIDYDTPTKTEDQNKTTFNATDVTLKGNFYNGTGYFDSMDAGSLDITLGKGAALTGVISSTTVQHVDENGKQNTHFTSNEYYYLGHVANQMYYNGGNKISVTLKDGASWTVTETGMISSLSIEKGCTFNGTIKVDGQVMQMNEVIAKGTVTGNIIVSPN